MLKRGGKEDFFEKTHSRRCKFRILFIVLAFFAQTFFRCAAPKKSLTFIAVKMGKNEEKPFLESLSKGENMKKLEGDVSYVYEPHGRSVFFTRSLEKVKQFQR